MHLHFLDPYQPRLSLVHAADARLKLALTLAFILTTSLTPFGAWPIYIFLLALILAVEILSSLGVGYVLKRSLLALPFVLAALPLPFTVEGHELFSVSLGGWTLTASAEGLTRLVSVALKSWFSVQAAIVLAASTQFPDLLAGMRALGVPRLLVAMFGLTWRYLFVLVDEALRLMRARAARSGTAAGRNTRSGGSVVWRARLTGGMVGNLFLRAFERADRIYVAMLSRGYDGEVRTLPSPPMSKSQRLVLGMGLFSLVLLLLLGLLFWG
ncbi:MAG: cobalt ECF transporter T component CbiQ [Anaerolineales bacterium]|nr:cobalt ECF transporter T component CbiQ [Anaerolineales bacterium]MCX7607597.1 cobalt ECF transporter T component CbiQ [Anaerolineales bacterium]MDW8227402.1 cobalt ECF transporter T component CbiQ [Anaerolineales bacterium]